jgi:hypothetical protein
LSSSSVEHIKDLLIDHCNPVLRARYFGVIFDEVPTYAELACGTPKLETSLEWMSFLSSLQGCFFGVPEDSCLEPLESISDWLLSSPDIDWNLQLRNASLSRLVPQYQL